MAILNNSLKFNRYINDKKINKNAAVLKETSKNQYLKQISKRTQTARRNYSEENILNIIIFFLLLFYFFSIYI